MHRSDRSVFAAELAQSVKRLTEGREVVGSIPGQNSGP